MLKKIKIYSNNNVHSNQIRNQLEEKLTNNGFVIVSEGEDVCVAIGGDGAYSEWLSKRILIVILNILGLILER